MENITFDQPNFQTCHLINIYYPGHKNYFKFSNATADYTVKKQPI